MVKVVAPRRAPVAPVRASSRTSGAAAPAAATNPMFDRTFALAVSPGMTATCEVVLRKSYAAGTVWPTATPLASTL